MKKNNSFVSLLFLCLTYLGAHASDTVPRNIAYIYGDETELETLVSNGEPVASSVTHYIMAFLYSETTSVDDLQLAFAPYDDLTAISSDLATTFQTLQDSGAKVMLGFGGASMNDIGFWSNYADDYETLAEAVAAYVTGTAIVGSTDTFQWDGVDIDWEDLDTSYAQAEFLYNFTIALRALLPSEDGYLISHAPQGGAYTAEKYLMVADYDYHYYSEALAYGDGDLAGNIDWLNVQFYNQGGGYYTDGAVTDADSSNTWMDTQDGNWNVINDYIALVEDDTSNAGTNPSADFVYGGIDSSKVVVGKPISDATTGIPTDASSMADNIVSVLYSGGTTDASVTGYGAEFGGTFLWVNFAVSDTVSDVDSWTSTLASAMSSSSTEDLLASSESIGSDHYSNTNVGFIYCNIDESPWVYGYALGWFFPAGRAPDFWLYVYDLDNWVYANPSLDGFTYYLSDDSWYYYDFSTNTFYKAE